jgi:hypothetical protein
MSDWTVSLVSRLCHCTPRDSLPSKQVTLPKINSLTQLLAFPTNLGLGRTLNGLMDGEVSTSTFTFQL